MATLQVDNHDIFTRVLSLMDQGKTVQITIKGNSMTPFLVGGRDAVLFATLDVATLRKGDVVLHRRTDGTYVMHRIIRIECHEFYVMGDVETEIEGPLAKEQLLAIATAFVRKGKQFSCENRAWRLLSYIWILLLPVRKPLLWANAWVGKHLKARRGQP